MAPTLSRTDHLTFQLRGPKHRRPPEQPSPSLLSASTFRQASASGWPDRSGSTWKEDLGADSTEAWQPRFQAPRPVGRGAWQPPTRQVPSDCQARLWAGTPSSCSARASDSLATVFVPEMLMRLTGARRFDEGLRRSPLPGHGGDPHKGTASWTVGPRIWRTVWCQSLPPPSCVGAGPESPGGPTRGRTREGNEIATSE